MSEFWYKQPVPQNKVIFESDGEIDSSRELRYEKTPLPDGYKWSSCDIDELYIFLKENYVSDEEFEFNYSKELIEWAINPPNYLKECNIAIREIESNKVIAFNSGIPLDVRINDKTIKMLQANFLCVHRDFRNTKFTPIIITEQVRRMNLCDIWQGISTIVRRIATPVTKVKYWHRLINVKKLNKLNFSNASEYTNRILGISHFRKMNENDIPRVTKMLYDHLNKFKLSIEIDESYVRHWILPRKDTVYTYLSDESDRFVTFYSLEYVHVQSGEIIKQAYMFYNVGNCLRDAIIIACNNGFDVFNCVNVGVEETDFRYYKFIEGTGYNHYYLWNWKINDEIKPKDIGFVIV